MRWLNVCVCGGGGEGTVHQRVGGCVCLWMYRWTRVGEFVDASAERGEVKVLWVGVLRRVDALVALRSDVPERPHERYGQYT